MGGEKLVILVVEKSRTSLKLLTKVLSEMEGDEAHVATATSLERAVARLDEEDFDAVLLDLELPDSQGLQTLSRVLEVEPDVPIIVVTDHQDEERALQAIQAGAQDYLMRGNLRPWVLSRSIRYAIERSRLLAKLRSMSLEDELTGLRSRRGFIVIAQQILKLVNRSGDRLALLYLDLDQLKWINEFLGRKTGDRALRDAARLLRSSFREADLVARIGGDEFAVLVMASEECSTIRIARRFQRNLHAFNSRSHRPYELSFSMGVVWYDPQEPLHLDELLAKADALMYEQKKGKLSMGLGDHVSRKRKTRR